MQGHNKRALDVGWPSQGLRVKRAILAGRRAGPSTPVPSWKVFNNQLYDGIAAAAAAHAAAGRPTPVSARKLAACLWELQDVPLPACLCNHHWPSCVKENSEVLTSSPSQTHGDLSPSAKACKFGSNQQLTNSSPEGGRRNAHAGRQAAAMRSHVHRLLDKRADSRSPYAGMNGGAAYLLEGQEHLSTAVMSNQKAWPGETKCIRTSTELLKVLNRIRNLEEQHNCSTSMASALQVELDHARSRMQELELAQKASRREVDSLLKRMADDRTTWRNREQEKIRAAVQTVREEVEEERKSRRRVEMVNRKISRELVEANTAVSKALEELERERKARELMEDVCDELAREISDDKAEVEELKQESVKVREEVEEERRMLQMAEVWREERVQMKLTEARLSLEEKSAVLDALCAELEVFLRVRKPTEEGARAEAEVLRNVVNAMHASGIASYPPADLDEVGSLDSDLYTVELSHGDRVGGSYSGMSLDAQPAGEDWNDMRGGDAQGRLSTFATSPDQPRAGNHNVWHIEEIKEDLSEAGYASESHNSERADTFQGDTKGEGSQWESASEEWQQNGCSVGSVRESEEEAATIGETVAGGAAWGGNAVEDAWTMTTSQHHEQSVGLHGTGFSHDQLHVVSDSVPQGGAWLSRDAGNPHIVRGIKGYVEWPKSAVDIGIKAKLYEAKLERHHARLRGAHQL